MRDLKKHGKCILYLDATGKVVRNIPSQQKKTFYYAACIKHDCKDEPAIPVVEMIANSHTTVTISLLLMTLRHATSSVTGKPVVPNRIECDFSWPLINSSLTVFCGMDVKQYIKMTWQLLKDDSQIERNDICIIHLCCSHIIKRFRDKIAAVCSDVNLSKFILFCFALLQNSTTLKFALDIYKAIKTVLESPYSTENVTESLTVLRQLI